MQFLTGVGLTRAIKKLSASKGEKKIAVAYWGRNAISFLGLDTKSRNIRVICCLKGGKSDPDIIERFKLRARQIDNLHAKVFWTPDAAIVSSANASSNGLPQDEDIASGLLEAGILVSEPHALSEIGGWFEERWNKAREINQRDLIAAKEARKLARVTAGAIPELIDLPLKEVEQAKIGILIWADDTTDAQNRAVERLNTFLNKVENASWFIDTEGNARQYPSKFSEDRYVLTFRTAPNRTRPRYSGIFRFPPLKNFEVIGPNEFVIFCQEVKAHEVPGARFTIGNKTKVAIATALKSAEMKLKVDLIHPEGGYTSWENLATLLTKHGNSGHAK